MKDFRDLKVWKRSHSLTLKIYKTTSEFPREETYGLTSQIRRSCASIPTNIAEGCGRARENNNFLCLPRMLVVRGLPCHGGAGQNYQG